MAAVAKSGVPSIATQTPGVEHRMAGKYAGEDLAAGDACYIAADNKVYRSTGAAANAAARVHGWCGIPCKAGEGVTLTWGVNFAYGLNLTPGANLYVSAGTPGALDDAPTTGGIRPVAFVFDPTRIHVMQSDY